MPPSTRTRKSAMAITSTTQATFKPSSFGRVSKSSSTKNTFDKAGLVKKLGCPDVFDMATLVLERQQPEVKRIEVVQSAEGDAISPTRVQKRKRAVDESEDEMVDGNSLEQTIDRRHKSQNQKKPKTQRRLQLFTPPASENGTDSEARTSPIKTDASSNQQKSKHNELPATLRDLVSLHASFLKALSLHFAHNGASSPAELDMLLFSTTRIWKKANVTKVDMQRMLALYEMDPECTVGQAQTASRTVTFRSGPFKMVTSGLGQNVRTNVEYMGSTSVKFGIFSEQKLQQFYQQLVTRLFADSALDEHSFVHTSTANFPLLQIQLGLQTQTQRQKASAMRADVLSKSKSQAELSMSSLSISESQNKTRSEEEHVTTTIKSRTLSLFDRIRTKNQLNANKANLTSEQITRHHAIGRIPEVVEFLRMKQGQKQRSASGFLADIDLDDGSQYSRSRSYAHGSVSHTATCTSSKVSFSMSQIVREVKESAPIPMCDEEIRVVIRILAEMETELNGWISIIQLGRVVSVTLSGNGVPFCGGQVKKLAEEREQQKVL